MPTPTSLRTRIAAIILAALGCFAVATVSGAAGQPDQAVVASSAVRVERAAADNTGGISGIAATDTPITLATTTTTTTTTIPPTTTTTAPPPPPPPPAVTGDPASNRLLGQHMAAERGWIGDQWACLDRLWTHESGWNHLISNQKGSGAYGIPQSLPGSKMSSHGADWATNPAVQIRWGLDYIANRYGTPCGANSHSLRLGWY